MTGAAPTDRDRRAHRRRPGVSDDEVLDAAEAILAEAGFSSLSARRLAEEVGASRQLVYTHFGSMNGLLDGLHRRLSDRLSVAIAGAAGPAGSREHILAATSEYRHVARRWPELYQLVFERPVDDYQVGPEALAESRRSFGQVVAAARAWLERAGGARSTDEALALARALNATIHGFMVLERVGLSNPEDTDDLSDRAIVALLDGWGS